MRLPTFIKYLLYAFMFHPSVADNDEAKTLYGLQQHLLLHRCPKDSVSRWSLLVFVSPRNFFYHKHTKQVRVQLQNPGGRFICVGYPPKGMPEPFSFHPPAIYHPVCHCTQWLRTCSCAISSISRCRCVCNICFLTAFNAWHKIPISKACQGGGILL